MPHLSRHRAAGQLAANAVRTFPGMTDDATANAVRPLSSRKAPWETRDDGTNLPDPVTEVRAALDGLTGTIDARLAELSTAIAEHRSRLDRVEARAARAGIAGTEQRDDAAEIETRAFSALIRRGREFMTADEIRSLRVSDDTAGGFLAPDQFVAELLRNVVQFSPIRQVARVANTASGAVILPRRTGRLTAQWVGETGARPSTEPTYGQARFPVHELTAYVDVSNTMLEDSALDIASELAFDFAEEFGRAEGAAFLNGSGTIQPVGLLTDATIPYTATGTAAAFPASAPADLLIAAYHALAPAYRGNAVWMMNSNTLAAIRKFRDNNGNYLLATAGIANAPTTTLLGRPVIEAPDLPDIGANALPIVFGDFGSGFRIFDRVALSVLRDPYTQVTNGLTRFHARRRVAAGVAKAEAFRAIKVAAS